MAEQLIPWLNGRLDLRQAYTFDRNHITAMLQNIVLSPGVYGVPAQNVARLMSIHQDITRLRCPDGQDYLAPAPPQNIDRQVHPRWPRGIARFQLRRSTYDGVEYWALPDLLGLFLSSLGPAPIGATKRNFYLPVTAVYGQWCTKLRTGVMPRVYQCSWTDRREFSLGASRGGFAVQDDIGSWLATTNMTVTITVTVVKIENLESIEAPMLTHILHDNVVVNDDDIVMEDVTSTAG